MSNKEIIENFRLKYIQLKEELSKVIIGQQRVIDEVIICIMSNGHMLLEGVPGLAKTLLVKSISNVLGIGYNRIQFTPDLMPSDILGNEIIDENRRINYNKGPIFSNIILADEINRTPPKTQSALLEAMQEKSVTIGGKNYPLPSPFFVLATQNPIEQEGTYPLPEAQLDRFMFNIRIYYPTIQEEIEIVKQSTFGELKQLECVFSEKEILDIQKIIRQIPVADNVIDYAVRIVNKTRPNGEISPEIVNNFIDWGAGPRASQNLILSSKANALIKGKISPDIEDVKEVAKPVLRHRIVRNYKAEAEGYTEDDIIEGIL